MIKITLVGAGGKMGLRLTDNFLKNPQYDVRYLEINKQGIERLQQKNITISTQKEAVPTADVVILGVPDITIGAISAEIIPNEARRFSNHTRSCRTAGWYYLSQG